VTVREMFADAQREVLRGDVSPARAGDLANTLSALLSNIAQEIREADMAYNVVYAKCLGEEKKANRAAIRANLSEEYARLKEAKDMLYVAEHMIRSLLEMQRTARTEMHLAR
jgi:hypothetical protein